MAEKYSGDQTTESGSKYQPGQIFVLNDGTGIRVVGLDRLSGNYGVYETSPGDKPETHAIFLSPEELDSLVEDLDSRTPEQSHELFTKIIEGDDNPELDPQFEPEVAPNASASEAHESPVEGASSNEIEAPAPDEGDELIDYSSIKPGDRVISKKPSAAGIYELTVSAARRNKRTGKMEYTLSDIQTKDGGETAHVWATEDDITEVIASAGPDSSEDEGVLQVNRGETKPQPEVPTNPKLDELARGFEQARSDGATPENTNSETDRLHDEWKNLVQELGSMMDKSSAQATELRHRIKKAFDAYNDAMSEDAADSAEGVDEPPETEDDSSRPLTPEEQARLDAIASRPGGNTPLGEAMANAQAEQAAQQAAAEQAEKERRFRAELALITQEVDGTHGEALRVAMGRYAELKADSETKGRIGRTKREKRLKEAEAVLLEAKLQYELGIVTKKREAGLYEGDEAQIDELSVNDMFDGIRSLDGRTREATNAVHERRKENRNLFQRQVLKVGKFFTDGGKIAKWVKGAGSGFAMGFGVAATGVGIPVTTAVGLGLGLGVRGAATVANLDQIRKDENTDAEGKATTVMSQSQFDQLIAGWKRNGANSPEQMTRSLGNEIFEKSRNRGYEQADRARRDANRAMGRFTIGFAAGGAANWAYNALNPSNGVAEAGRGVAEGGSTSGGAEAAGGDGGSAGAGEASGGDGAGPSGPELPPGAENIHEGEGWFSQFADMGMTEDQVKAMFSDTDLMNKLVDSGAAYPDNSKIIGGYGINMPASGRLAPDVMQIIADARAAKGF